MWDLRHGLMVALLAGLTGSAGSPARAAEVDQATQDALQSVITQQIDAFGRDDAAAAQSFAAPGIKAKFPDARDFVTMVHRTYAALIHPRSTHFDGAAQAATGPVERVTVVDSAGLPWTVLYSFEQADGQWRINGCVLVQDKSTPI